jgi:carbonic anhydrase
MRHARVPRNSAAREFGPSVGQPSPRWLKHRPRLADIPASRVRSSVARARNGVFTMTMCTRVRVLPAVDQARWRLASAAALLLAAAALASVPARAADGHVPSSATTHAASAPAAAKPVVPKAAAAADDGLALVQSRLAARLGGHSSDAGGSASPVMRVVARGGAPATAVPSASHAGTAPATTASAAAVPTPARAKPAAGHSPHWAYDGEGGPAAWGRLQPEFSICAIGKRQSPIDIRDGLKLSLDAVTFDYKPSAFKVIDNGHTVQVELAPGNSIEVMGQRFELLQFHFHRPSEESIDGRRFDMVAHFVHKSVEGRLAVVAVLIERGAAQPQLQQVWNNLPLEKGDSVAARAPLDLERLLPEQRGYFTYMGSLTTPPCSEGVLWMVMKQPLQATPEQLGIFARLYPMNARPIQSAAGRLIKESN